MQILVNHRVSHVMSHVTRIPSSNQDRIQDMIQRWENESETNCIMKFSFLKCSKNRTWRKLLIWTWSRKIKFLHFVKLLFSQQIIENKNFDLSGVFWCFFRKVGQIESTISRLAVKSRIFMAEWMNRYTSHLSANQAIRGPIKIPLQLIDKFSPMMSPLSKCTV